MLPTAAAAAGAQGLELELQPRVDVLKCSAWQLSGDEAGLNEMEALPDLRCVPVCAFGCGGIVGVG